MNKSMLVALVGFTLTCIGGVAAASQLGEAAQLSLDGHVYNKSISSRKDWVNTGIKVLDGQILSVQASGNVSTLPQGSSSDPDGQSYNCNEQCTHPEGKFGQLIGKIGEAGSAFIIGSHYATMSHESGVLFLGANDCCDWSDNTGDFQATITIYDSSICNDRETRSIFERTPSSYHRYERSFSVCLIGTPCCTVDRVFALMASQLRFVAPTEDVSPVKNCGVAVLPGNNPIRTVIDHTAHSVGNYTKDGHVFHPGRVVRTVTELGDAVVVTTFGEGNGDYRWLNENFFSYTWPVLVDPKLWQEKLLSACSTP